METDRERERERELFVLDKTQKRWGGCSFVEYKYECARRYSTKIRGVANRSNVVVTKMLLQYIGLHEHFVHASRLIAVI